MTVLLISLGVITGFALGWWLATRRLRATVRQALAYADGQVDVIRERVDRMEQTAIEVARAELGEELGRSQKRVKDLEKLAESAGLI